MNKNKGFTLVELLAVIIILAMLVAFSTVAISKIKKKQDLKNRENVISSILTGAKAFNAETRFNDNITVSDLIKSGYVEFDQNKYSDLVGESVYKEICKETGNDLKVRYKLGNLNDCGCKEQDTFSPKTLCEEE